mgnify:CR=1 FL=1
MPRFDDGRQQEPAQRLAPGPGVGNCRSTKRQRRVHDDEIQAHRRCLHQAALEVGEMHAVQNLEIGNPRLGDGLLGSRGELPGERPLGAGDGPQQRRAEDESKQRDRGRAEQRAQSARLRGFFERNLQTGDDLGGHTLNGLPDRLSTSAVVSPSTTRDPTVISAPPSKNSEATGPEIPCATRSSSARPGAGRRSIGDRPRTVRLEEDDGPIDVREGEASRWMASRVRNAADGRQRRRLGSRRWLSLGLSAGRAA